MRIDGTMKKAALLPLAFLLVGCRSDDAGSLSRDYRNINNEAIDAMMMVTSEARAKLANDKILKTYSDRLGKIDHRMDLWVQNTDDKLIVFEVMLSESVTMLIAESKINSTRLGLEVSRLKRLLDTKVGDEVERRKSAGEANPVVDTRKEWPNLADLSTGNPASALKTNLTKGSRLGELMKKFSTKEWEKQRPPNFNELQKQFDERVKAFEAL